MPHVDEWHSVKKKVLAEFQPDERFDGRLIDKRMRITHKDAEERKDRMVDRAKKGAEARWKKEQKQDPAVAEMDKE